MGNLDNSGPFSAEKILERISSARDQATKEATRLAIISIALVAIFTIKASGLRADIVFLDQKVLELPYGTFFFCISSQFIMCLAWMRSSDARAWDRQLSKFCAVQWPDQAETVYETYANSNSWHGPTSMWMRKVKKTGISGLFFNLTTAISVLLFLAIYLSPIISGMFFIFDWKNQISAGNIDLQYYLVLFSSILNFSWFINSLVIHELSDKVTLASSGAKGA